jgi:hypothetical protein
MALRFMSRPTADQAAPPVTGQTEDVPHRDAIGRRAIAHAFVFFAAVCVLTSSGRLASWDAGAQLQSSLLLASTGALGTTEAPEPRWFWVANGRGVSYETHDLGGLLLMWPGAVLTAWLHADADGPDRSGARPSALVADPPPEARLLGSLSYALAGAATCTFLFAALRVFGPTREAFAGALVFLGCTGIWPYFRTAWDVTGAAAAIAAFQYGMVVLAARERSGRREAALLGMAGAAAITFRFSLLPVVCIAAASLAWACRRKLRPATWMAFAVAFALAAGPQLAYNWVRTGHPLVPGNRAPIYASQNSLDGNPIVGFLGLMASPHKGLIFFAPITLLALLAPRVLSRTLTGTARTVALAGLAGAACYVAIISAKREWGAFGWGPRYLVPILPLIFLPLGLALRSAWHSRPRTTLTLVATSLLSTGPALIVNWSLAVAEQGATAGPLWPAQHEAVLSRLLAALRAPDNWLVQLAALSPAGAAAAIAVLLTGIAVMSWSARSLLRSTHAERRTSNAGAAA